MTVSNYITSLFSIWTKHEKKGGLFPASPKCVLIHRRTGLLSVHRYRVATTPTTYDLWLFPWEHPDENADNERGHQRILSNCPCEQPSPQVVV